MRPREGIHDTRKGLHVCLRQNFPMEYTVCSSRLAAQMDSIRLLSAKTFAQLAMDAYIEHLENVHHEQQESETFQPAMRMLPMMPRTLFPCRRESKLARRSSLSKVARRTSSRHRLQTRQGERTCPCRTGRRYLLTIPFFPRVRW